MELKSVDVVETIAPQDFHKQYYVPRRPVIIKDLSKRWPAYKKWNWDYLKEKVGAVKVGVYNNVKSDPYTPVNKSDGEMKFGDYLDLVKKGPVGLRIFLFNILEHNKEMQNDYSYPDELISGFLKKYPMLFVGGQGSITHMHYDMDLSHILHTQFLGKKRVLIFDYEEGRKLYHLPFTVQRLVNFEKYYECIDENQFPALKYLKGYEVILEHGDTLYMPAGYWHHMEYLESCLALSLRAFDEKLSTKMKGIFNLVGMRNIDTLLKKSMPDIWYNYKKNLAIKHASEVLEEVS